MFAKIIEGDKYVNIAALKLCDVEYGLSIYTPKGKVYKSDLHGFTYAESLRECLDLLEVDDKHMYSVDDYTYTNAREDAAYKGYKTFIYDDKIYKVSND